MTPFHGDDLHISRTQILPDLAASEAKHEASTVVYADWRISDHCRILLDDRAVYSIALLSRDGQICK